MKTDVIDMAGRVCGRLTVLSRADNNKRGNAMWNCICECGTTGAFNGQRLRRGDTMSCGCIRVERARKQLLKHGEASMRVGRTTEYTTWVNMIDRCANQNRKEWPRYGGRGITVCERWRASFEDFLSDVGRKPTPRHSLDRYPNKNGNYEPGNVRWATSKQQGRNTRTNHLVNVSGDTVCIAQAAEDNNVSQHLIAQRIRRGETADQAVSRPARVAEKFPFRGSMYTMEEICKLTGISISVIHRRLHRYGKDGDMAVAEALRNNRGRKNMEKNHG